MDFFFKKCLIGFSGRSLKSDTQGTRLTLSGTLQEPATAGCEGGRRRWEGSEEEETQKLNLSPPIDGGHVWAGIY